MQAKSVYLIPSRLIAILPEYSKYGELYSNILEVNYSFVNERNPYDTIDDHCLYYGSALRGKIEGANSILKTKINPIALNGPESIILIPTKSPMSKDGIWFNLEHIIDFQALGKREILVFLSNGDTIRVENSYKQFKSRVDRGYILRTKLEERQNLQHLQSHYILDPGKRYHYQRNNGKLNFEMVIQNKRDNKDK
ncbi:competence protein ComK [Chungangia koreensis]|uniref:Competence protein ComK n=1 Tax=Chungangia koreensis TaxID=752657 RepID=A0ABV8X2G4_9LACT